MCKKREKRESEGVGVSVSFSEEKAVYNILVLRSLEKYSNLVKKKKKNPNIPEAVTQLFLTSCSFFCAKRSPCF